MECPRRTKLIGLVHTWRQFQQSKLVVNGYADNAPVGQALQRQGITSNEVLSQSVPKP